MSSLFDCPGVKKGFPPPQCYAHAPPTLLFSRPRVPTVGGGEARNERLQAPRPRPQGLHPGQPGALPRRPGSRPRGVAHASCIPAHGTQVSCTNKPLPPRDALLIHSQARINRPRVWFPPSSSSSSSSSPLPAPPPAPPSLPPILLLRPPGMDQAVIIALIAITRAQAAF